MKHTKGKVRKRVSNGGRLCSRIWGRQRWEGSGSVRQVVNTQLIVPCP